MPGAAKSDLVQTGLFSGKSFWRQVPESLDAIMPRGRFALTAAFIVLAIHQSPLDAGMHDHDRQISGQGNGDGFQAAAIDQKRVPGLGAGADQLVHDAAIAAGEFVLGLLTGEGEARAVKTRLARKRCERQTDSVLERG